MYFELAFVISIPIKEIKSCSNKIFKAISKNSGDDSHVHQGWFKCLITELSPPDSVASIEYTEM